MNPPSTPSDEICRRHHLNLMGSGDTTLLLVHGYGCDQRVWRHLAPVLADRYRVVLMDLMGFGDSDCAAYRADRYQGLDGHAQDVAAVGRALGPGRTVLVGHSVAAMVGVLADALAPEAFAAHVMVAPSPCLQNVGGYRGGFDAPQLEALLAAQDQDWFAWARTVTGWATGLPKWQPVAEELNESFGRADRRAARALARASFLGDHRAALPGLAKPTLVLQATQDPVASEQVGAYITASVGRGELRLVDSVGHFPHLTAPRECLREIERFLERTVPA
jgi:sigma-B regulation protein RsbQ